jgi:hypothetical protein
MSSGWKYLRLSEWERCPGYNPDSPTVDTLAADDRACSLVREDSLGANERRRAWRRATRNAFRSWDPTPTRDHEYYSKPQVNLHKKRSDDGCTGRTHKPRPSPQGHQPLFGVKGQQRVSLVRHIILFRSHGLACGCSDATAGSGHRDRTLIKGDGRGGLRAATFSGPDAVICP